MQTVRKILISIAGLFGFVVFAPSVYVMLKNIDAFLPKYGTIVDADTGKGMADVPVIAIATAGIHGILTAGRVDTLYRVIVHADAEGNYRIPSAFTSAPFWLYFPRTEPEITWAITAFRMGYAVKGDEQAWELHADGRTYPPVSTTSEPASHASMDGVYVAPITMYRVNLSLGQAARYYARVIDADHTFSYRESQSIQERALRRPAYDYFMSKICAMDPDTVLDWSAGNFADDIPKYSDLEFTEWKRSKAISMSQSERAYKLAGFQCKALKLAQDKSK